MPKCVIHMSECVIHMKFNVTPQSDSEKLQLIEAIHTLYSGISALPGIGSCEYHKVDVSEEIPAPF